MHFSQNARIAIDGHELDYPLTFEVVGRKRYWPFSPDPSAWIKAFATTERTENVVSLRVVTGQTIGTYFASQVFELSDN